MQLLEDLESGELENKYSPKQLHQINEYFSTLAKEGILPDEHKEEVELKKDTVDLMYGIDSAFQLTQNINEGIIIPAVCNSYLGYNIIQCGKISKAWKKTKQFVKKHKKAIIIGAVVVVVVVTVTVVVVMTSSAGTAAAAASAMGAAAKGAASESPDSTKSKSKNEPSPAPVAASPKEEPPTNAEMPIMKAAIDEQVTSFKEFLVEDKAAQQATASKEWDDLSFGEKTRELGAHLAHQAYDEVTELVQVVPQLCEEVKEIGSKFFPESFSIPNDESNKSPMENYEHLVATGHKMIDNAFSTDQSEFFTPEAKANDPMNHFAIGILPLPGPFNQIFSNSIQFKEAGKVLDRAGFTKAGRGLMKHGYREGSIFPKPIGSPAAINKQGQMILEEILDNPNNKIYQFKDGSLKIYAPNGRGASFRKDGTFKGFIEQQYE
jgi:hypothetical protein